MTQSRPNQEMGRGNQAGSEQGELLFFINLDQAGLHGGSAHRRVESRWESLGVLGGSDEAGSVQWVDSLWRKTPEALASIYYRHPNHGYLTIFHRSAYGEYQEFMREVGISGLEDAKGRYR